MRVFWKIIATGFGAGYAPVAPGTAGALVGALFLVPALAGFLPLPYPVFCGVLIVVFFFAGVIATNRLEPEWGHDPQKIVVDEMVGVWVTLFLLPLSWATLAAGFVLFRVFDI
ncbi:MAG: phosphatidylglycerophosphatase A, partial [Bacteroidetes bacterium]